MKRKIPHVLAIAAFVAAIAGCGSNDPNPPVATHTVSYLSGAPANVERLTGNAFRAQLYRLAVLSQHTDDASDLGQSLPTGLLDKTSCAPATDRPASGVWHWKCKVNWTTVDGKHSSVSYKTQLTDNGCFYATADPPLPQVQDNTTHAPAENPLGYLTGRIKGC